MRDAKEVAEEAMQWWDQDQVRPIVNIIYHTILSDRRKVWAEAMRRAKEAVRDRAKDLYDQGYKMNLVDATDALDKLEKEGPYA